MKIEQTTGKQILQYWTIVIFKLVSIHLSSIQNPMHPCICQSNNIFFILQTGQYLVNLFNAFKRRIDVK